MCEALSSISLGMCNFTLPLWNPRSPSRPPLEAEEKTERGQGGKHVFEGRLRPKMWA